MNLTTEEKELIIVGLESLRGSFSILRGFGKKGNTELAVERLIKKLTK